MPAFDLEGEGSSKGAGVGSRAFWPKCGLICEHLLFTIKNYRRVAAVMKKISLLVLAGLLYGSSLAVYAQAFAVPRSDEVVQVEIILPGGGQAKVEVRDGTMLTIRDEELGSMYGFAMTVDPGAARATMTTVEISDLSGGGQAVKQVGGASENLVEGYPLEVSTPFGVFGFRLAGIVEGQFPNLRPLKNPLKSGRTPSQLQKLFGKSGGGTCCVTCGVLTICGTRVTLDCGSCDSGGGSRMTY